MTYGDRARGTAAWDRRPLTVLRGAGLLALVVLGVWGTSLTPEREVPWHGVVELRISAEDCDERRETRQFGPFTLPASHPQSVPWRTVGEWFRIDLEHLCSVNGLSLGECERRELAPGEEMTIPFRYHAPGPPTRIANREKALGP